jgi:hypothetical protein
MDVVLPEKRIYGGKLKNRAMTPKAGAGAHRSGKHLFAERLGGARAATLPCLSGVLFNGAAQAETRHQAVLAVATLDAVAASVATLCGCATPGSRSTPRLHRQKFSRMQRKWAFLLEFQAMVRPEGMHRSQPARMHRGMSSKQLKREWAQSGEATSAGGGLTGVAAGVAIAEGNSEKK